MLGLSLGVEHSNYKEFTLSDVGSLSLWLKNGVGVTASKWDDSSGNNNHATQGTAANQATTNDIHAGLDFEASDPDFYSLASSISIAYRGGFCMAIVMQRESTTNQAVFSDSVNEQLSFTAGTTSFVLKTNTGASGAQNIVTTANFPAGTFAAGEKLIFLVNRSVGTSNVFSFFKNGVALTADTDTSSNEATGENPNGFDFDTLGASNSGSGNHFDGIILEVAFWSKGLNTQEIADVNSYLKSFHGL